LAWAEKKAMALEHAARGVAAQRGRLFMEKIGRKLRRLRELPAGDRWRLAQATVGLPINAAGVRLAGFRRWGACLARAAGSRRRPASGGLQTARETWRLVQWAARYGPYRGNCLSQSLTLWWLLRRQGLESDLRIGVSTAGGRFEAHAWIEFQGIVVNDRPDVRERFGVFDMPAGSAIPFA
jgi:Transglutaminase-like superfamily